jgi:enoyl-CoA hydratase/carnithine racemase
MQFRNIVFSVDGGIATITLNTPKNLNAFNEAMIEDV